MDDLRIRWCDFEWGTPLHLVAGTWLFLRALSISFVWEDDGCQYQAYSCDELNGCSVNCSAVAQFVNGGLARAHIVLPEPTPAPPEWPEGKTSLSLEEAAPVFGPSLFTYAKALHDCDVDKRRLLAHFRKLYGVPQPRIPALERLGRYLYRWTESNGSTYCSIIRLPLKPLQVIFESGAPQQGNLFKMANAYFTQSGEAPNGL